MNWLLNDVNEDLVPFKRTEMVDIERYKERSGIQY